MQDRDYLHRVQSLTQNSRGEPHGSTDDIADVFAGCGPATRMAALDAFDRELNRDSPTDLRRYAELTSLRRKMGQVHDALREAGK